MTASQGFVVPAGGGKHVGDSEPDRFSHLKGGPGTCAFMPRNVPHAWKNCGSTPGRVLFLYTPAIAGRFVERMVEGPKSQEERDKQLKEYGWELLGPNPL